MPPAEGLVFLLDVDNTLFDNDAFKSAIATEAVAVLGEEGARLFWDLYEQVRRETDTVDYPTTLQRLAQAGYPAQSGRLRAFLEGYEFAGGLYPQTRETLRYLRTLGRCVVLSDGDPVFQPYKISRAGLADLVDGVLIYVHKEQHLDEITALYPGDHYVTVDDKARLLAAIKERWGEAVTTVFVRQGHYAAEALAAGLPPVDLQIGTIGEAQTISADEYRAAARAGFPPAPPALS
jgi:hypothetical protein